MAEALALHLWQSTLVLMLAWGLTRLCRRNSASLRFYIWFCAALKLLVPFAWLQQLGDYIGRALPAPLAIGPALLETGGAIFVPSFTGVSVIADDMRPNLYMALVIIWACGAAVLLIRWLAQYLAMRSMLRSAPQLPMDLPIPVRVVATELTPGVFGVFRPVLILPKSVLSELSASQLQAIVAHEMCHVRRRDNLLAAMHKCIEVLFWFYPPVWWIGANLLREREAACDESVLEEGHEQSVYAESILTVCRLGVTARVAGVAASIGGCLHQRLTSIMSEQRALPIDQPRFWLLASVAMAMLYGPVMAGIASTALREASATGSIIFETITLQSAKTDSGWRRGAQFDPDAGHLALDNVSLRQLIALAYPASRVNGEPDLIDSIHYDIQARWHAEGHASERGVYRELLSRILRTNSNLQLYVKDGCGDACDYVRGQLVAGRIR
ncbi:M56 family metallopeptidase [Steroidobacter sp.]|uniref:M56 family metallopeptidase n=1 Tax=Steroidobacter sp. TaxID=1978227 RepID=UPI001A459066|nr:M56 family metallopeptidase [Steroidobacter sp.]MBL8268755.1 hypothetical protein [Steroidobacter sp.]